MLPLDYNGNLQELLSGVRVLVVGAGGIGCELLKDLVMTGFNNIKCIDLDTIEMSNLNRQFLFRKYHVGQSKAKVAAEAVKEYNPNVVIDSEYGNIKDTKYDYEFFKSFDIVFNALDNMQARRHVNEMCIASQVPLIESGTTGLLGQSYPIIPYVSECYDCKPHESNQKQYPMCTIRSTPDKIEHCIVFGKELFGLLFGVQTDSLLYEETGSVYMDSMRNIQNQGNDTELLSHIYTFIHALYYNDIERKLELGGYKTSLTRPTPIDINKYINSSIPVLGDYTHHYEHIFTLEENISGLVACIYLLCKDNTHCATFDKENHIHMTFVTCASNLRALLFHIPPSSYFHIKEIAGNIIPAVASANAIVAGVQVINAIKLLMNRKQNDKKQYEYNKNDYAYTTLSKTKSGAGNIIQSFPLNAPNPSCSVCGSVPLRCVMDIYKATFRGFIEGIIKDQCHIESPIVIKDGTIIYDDDDDDDDDDNNDNDDNDDNNDNNDDDDNNNNKDHYHCSLCKETMTHPNTKSHPYYSLTMDQLPNAHVCNGSKLYIEDAESDKNIMIQFFYKPLDDILEEHEEGFYFLNSDVLSTMNKPITSSITKSEDEKSTNSSDSSDLEAIEDEDEDEIQYIGITDSQSTNKRVSENINHNNKRIQQ